MARPSPQPDAPGGAERKLVTVLLVDVDEAREGFADVDPEDAGRLLSGPLARVRAEVEAHGGVVEETVGGRTVALFGIPRTRDDDPERAVRAALAVRDALTAAAAGGAPVRVQAAVATGEALVRPAGAGPAARGSSATPWAPPPGSRSWCRTGPCWCRRRPGGPPSGRSPTVPPARARRAPATPLPPGRRWPRGPARPPPAGGSRPWWPGTASWRRCSPPPAGPAPARSWSPSSAPPASARAGCWPSWPTAWPPDPPPGPSPGGRGGRCPTATGRPSGRWPRRSRPRPASSRATGPSSPAGAWPWPRGGGRPGHRRLGRRPPAPPGRGRLPARVGRRADHRRRPRGGVRRLAALPARPGRHPAAGPGPGGPAPGRRRPARLRREPGRPGRRPGGRPGPGHGPAGAAGAPARLGRRRDHHPARAPRRPPTPPACWPPSWPTTACPPRSTPPCWPGRRQPAVRRGVRAHAARPRRPGPQPAPPIHRGAA